MHPCVLVVKTMLSGGEETYLNDFSCRGQRILSEHFGFRGSRPPPQNPLVVVRSGYVTCFCRKASNSRLSVLIGVYEDHVKGNAFLVRNLAFLFDFENLGNRFYSVLADTYK